MDCCRSQKHTLKLKMPQPTNWGSLKAQLQSYIEALKSWKTSVSHNQQLASRPYLSDFTASQPTSLNLHLPNQRSLFPYLLQLNCIITSCKYVNCVLHSILLGTKLGQQQKLQSSVTHNFLKSLSNFVYRCAPVSMGNTIQELPWLCETADNTERYI
jgi:hypothetical protein